MDLRINRGKNVLLNLGMLEIQRPECTPSRNVNHRIQVKRGREVGITSFRPSLARYYNHNHIGEASVCYECKGVIITLSFTMIGRGIVKVGREAAEYDQGGKEKQGAEQALTRTRERDGSARENHLSSLHSAGGLERKGDCGKYCEDCDTAGS